MKVGSGTCLRAGVIALALFVGTTASANAQAIITNGTGVALGVAREGHLNIPESVAINPDNSSRVGVSFLTDYNGNGTSEWNDATSPGCFCEGWGVSADLVVGRASVDNGGVAGLSFVSFVSDASSATSTVALTALPGLTVTHAYAPSSSPSLYQAEVTITNATGGAIADLRYRRVMDWDVPLTEFNELVTLQGAGLGDLIDSCDDGFEVPDPRSDCSPILAGLEDVNFVDAGPADHGASFTFGFGALANGASKTFKIFYGAASTEAAALAALAAVGAEGIYSFGQPSAREAATFIFGFGGVGAPPIVPEPATLFLLGGGLATVMVRRYRRG